ncbi:IPT/TIG domain-containing protein, partial [Kineosporia rhizophila]|uniref:IPT/TIG domain-containing protein n=1 Tax=Kineosporia rhizophila TaxID=84633 RepID=UPI001E3DCCFD
MAISRISVARLLIVVLLAWILVPVTAQPGQAFAGTVAASAYASRDITNGNTTVAASTYPGSTSASASGGTMTSTANADPLADTAAATAKADGYGLGAILSLATATAECTAGPTGVTGKARAGGLTLLTIPLNNVPTGDIPPNTTVQLTNLFGQNVGYITYNEQTITNSGGQYYISVTAAHIVSKTTAGVINGNVELAHVECGSTAPITPTVSAVSPNQGPETGATSVTVTGTNFLAVTGVKFGSVNATSFTVTSLTSLTAVAPAGTGKADLRITNVAGTNADNAADDFNYIPKPVITSVTPTRGPTSGGTSVVITGTNLATATAVKFGANAATSLTVNSNTSVTAVAPARTPLNTNVTVDITVTTVGGTSNAVTADEYTYFAPPTVTAVAPSAGPLTSGNSVTITGTNFIGPSGVSAVKFGAANAVSYTVNSDTQITAVAPAGTAGTVDITVVAVGGTSAITAADQYTYTPAPTVTAVAPSAGPTAAGTSVVITGTNFGSATEVKFGADPAVSFVRNSATQITAVAPAGAAGTVDVTVTSPGGTSATSAADRYTYVATPAVTNVAPKRGPLAGGTSVVITGTGFSTATAVKFDATNATSFTVNSATQITAVAPAGSAGTVDITVTTPGGTSATTSADRFTYVAAPTVSNVSPSGGPIAGGTSVTVTGTNFTDASVVTFGGVPASAVTVSSDTQLVVTAPAQGAGTVDVVVTAPGGTSATSSADRFTYYATPAVSAVSPSSGPTTAGTVVVITGTALAGATGVKFGANTAVSFTVNSSTQITATAPSGSVGVVDVTVTTPGGTSPTSSVDQFTYVGPPTVSAVSPARGPLGGGNSVVITGTGLTGASAVKFGATNASSFTVNSATQITAVAPAGSLGTIDVTVTTTGGTSAVSSADQYAYVGAPTVTAISPTAGPIAGGTAVTITGTGFTGATAVSFGGVAASGVITVSSDTQITALAPMQSAGTVDVRVTAPGGVSAVTAADRFTYVSPPAVTGITPSSGPISGGVNQTVTITGTDFTGATQVTFDNYPTLQILSVTSTQIQVRGVPPHATGPVHVQVTTPYGTSAQTPADVYTYQGLPTLTAVSPSSGPLGGGNAVILTGTGLSTASDVKFGSATATFTVNSDTQITATAPAGSAGAVTVSVTTSYGTTGGPNPPPYTYVAAPVVSSVAPASGPLAGGTAVTITGTGFSGATSVAFDGVAATSLTVSSDTQITAFTPAHAAGAVNVSVTSVGGTGSLNNAFTYVAAPAVTSVSPTSGPVGGGTSVTITGTGFSAATAVSFGGSAASSFTVNSGTQITALAPAGTAGTVDVRVTTVGGTSAVVPGDRFTYVAVPVVQGVAPQAGPLAGGNTVVITGTGFTGASAVAFGGSTATSFTVDSPTQITAVAPSGAAGTVDVRVTTVGGTSAVVVGDRYTYQAVPSVTALTPTHGPIAGGTLVTITGANFSGATSVTFDGTPAIGVIAVNSDNQIIAAAPAHAAGVVDVVVTAPGGVSTPISYRYVGTPTISGLSPANGPTVGGTSVVLTGTGFATASGAAAVQFGGTNAASYTVNSDTQITAVTPAKAAGTAGVTVTTADGGTSAVTPSSIFTFIPAPTVTSITPTSGPEAGGTSVIINGTGLTTASSVRFDGSAASFVVDSDTRITATAPAGSGLVNVTVTTVGGTATDLFRYVGTPTVTSLSPATGPVAGGTSVTITGTQFYGVNGVTFGGTAAGFTVVSPTEITAVAPAHAAGGVDVRVTTALGGTSAPGQTFTYVADPVVTGLAPTSGPVPGGTVVVISGSGFSAATAVKFGATPAASFTVNGGSQITAVSPAGAVGTVDVTVTGQFATSATSAASRFTYAAAPTVASVSPAAGPLAGGNTVTISGTGFTVNSAVSFGAVPASSVQFGSATQLTAVVPAGAAGPVDVEVATQYGQDTLNNGYRYRAAPSLTSVSPAVGPESGATTVTITGSGFDGATAVRFGSVPATLFTVSTDGLITATSPAGTGTVDVTVTGPGGTSPVVPAGEFTYAPVPVLASVSPAFGPTAGGTVVTLSGSGFTGATSVTLAGAPVAFSVVNDSAITLTTPGGSGDVPIVVTTPGGTTAPRQFTYANAPSVSGLTPDRGPLGGGTSVTIDGTGFTSGSTVTFGGTAAASVQFVNSTRLIAVTPARVTPGLVTTTITTPYGSASGAFRYVAAPTVTAVQPTAGPLAGGTVVTLTGTGFTDASAVSFGPTPATTFTVNSDTSITATAPARAAGTVDITVTTPGGTSATSGADQFSYLPAPTVGQVQPNSGPVGGGTVVTITGTGFTPGSSVTFGGDPATAVNYVSPTELKATSPAAAGSSGSVLVRVTTPGGSDSAIFTYRDAPTVSQVQPDSGPEAGGNTVTITGSDFNGATVVRFGATAATFTVDSSTRITATVPVGTGTVDVRVTGPGGTSATSPADRYRYAPVPAVSSLSPTFGPTIGGTSLTVSGSGFTGASTVTMRGNSVPFTIDNDSTITLTTPAGAQGDAAIEVTTPGGTSAPVQFRYADAPTVTTATPDAGPLGGGTIVTITGTDFTPASTVTFGGASATSVTYVSPTRLEAESPSRGTAGAVNIVVTTAYGASSPMSFTYTNAPTISAVAPSAGPVAGGTSVTISGSGLTGASAVTFDGTPAASFTVNNDSTITAVTPPGSAGTAVVRVTTVGGSDTGSFRYAAFPSISAVSP